jgi:hypothetical protein
MWTVGPVAAGVEAPCWAWLDVVVATTPKSRSKGKRRKFFIPYVDRRIAGRVVTWKRVRLGREHMIQLLWKLYTAV